MFVVDVTIQSFCCLASGKCIVVTDKSRQKEDQGMHSMSYWPTGNNRWKTGVVASPGRVALRAIKRSKLYPYK